MNSNIIMHEFKNRRSSMEEISEWKVARHQMKLSELETQIISEYEKDTIKITRETQKKLENEIKV